MPGKNSATATQNYPRINNHGGDYDGLLDVEKLKPHTHKIPVDLLNELINRAIINASKKSGREFLKIPVDTTESDLAAIYKKKGRDLFKYFHDYCGDPASTSQQLIGKDVRRVGVEQFRLSTLQKERMNSGWRYQFLAYYAAQESQRFSSVSQAGPSETDFHAVIEFTSGQDQLNLFVSVKNRASTLGGQDWPKAIEALEASAKADRNMIGPYCCVFGIAISGGNRLIRRSIRNNKTKITYSSNTEVWLANFFWPFFTNYDYEELMEHVLNVLLNTTAPDKLTLDIGVPPEVLDSFQAACEQYELLDQDGQFTDAHRLVHFFCQPLRASGRSKSKAQN